MMDGADQRGSLSVVVADHHNVNKAAYQERKERGQCTRYNCPELALDGYQLCARHRENQNAAQRKAMKRKRQRWAKQGKCTRCGRRRKAGHAWACSGCLASLRRLRTPADHQHVNKSQRIAERTVVDNDNRRRFRGQLRKGRMSRADENRHDVEAIERDLHVFREELAERDSDSANALPPIQRDGERRKTFARLGMLVRRALDLAKRNRCPIEIGDSAGDDED